MRTISTFILILAICGCAVKQKENSLHLNQYIVIEMHSPTEISINKRVIPLDAVNEQMITNLMTEYASKDFLLGLNQSFIIKDLMKLGPIISNANANIFLLNKKGEINTLNFVNQ